MAKTIPMVAASKNIWLGTSPKKGEDLATTYVKAVGINYKSPYKGMPRTKATMDPGKLAGLST